MKDVIISTPSVVPEFADAVWSRILRDMTSALNGRWSSFDYAQHTQSSNLNVDLYQVERLGQLVFISVRGVSSSGNSGTISIPFDSMGDAALSGFNCRARIVNNQIQIINITNPFLFSGVYIARS